MARRAGGLSPDADNRRMRTVSPQEYAALTRQAQACVEAGHLGEAEPVLMEIVRLNPREHYAWGLLARAALEQGQADIAQEHARRALELDRRNADYLNLLGIAQAERGDLDRAESSLRRALREKPTHANAHFNLAKLIEKRGDWAGAVREYERTLSVDPKYRGALRNKARALMKLGDPEGAMRALEGAVIEGTAEPICLITYGNALAATRGLDAAIDFYADVCRRQPGSGLLRRAHAHSLLQGGVYGRGWQEYLARNFGGPGSPTSVPEPLPQRLDGRAFHLVPEMGLGDFLFFLRFVPELVARGARVSITAPDKLAPLLARTGVFTSGPRRSPTGTCRAFSRARCRCRRFSSSPTRASRTSGGRGSRNWVRPLTSA
jgi:Tfp pilus assembly protein PilF